MKLKLLISLIVVIIIITFISLINKNNNVVEISSNISLSTNKIEWGIKRNSNHEQPDLGNKNRELIEKYEGLSMGNKNEKIIYLTFDNGYEAGYTEKILDTLKENNVPAAFFITAHYVNTAQELVERMISEGHIVGNHTVNHKSIPTLDETSLTNEIMNLHKAVYEKYGYEMKYIRPPKGEYSEYSLSILKKLGYTPVMWSFAYADWDENKQPTKDDAIKKIIDNVHNGEIILLHATSKTNMEILDIMIKKIKDMGYEFKSLDEFTI